MTGRSHPERAGPTDPEADPRTVMSGARRLVVYGGGCGARSTAVVAHGVGSSPRFIHDAFAAPLGAAGIQLVTYDLRGHGRSEPARDEADHALAHHAADLSAVVEDVEATHVGGVSLGAHAAAVVAAAHGRIETAYLCLPAGFGQLPSRSPHTALAAEVRRDGVGVVLDRAISDPEVPAWLSRLLARDWPTHDEQSLAAALIALDEAVAPDRDVLAHVNAPGAVVGWPDDPGHPLAVARKWAAAMPRGTLEVVQIAHVGREPAVLGRAALRGSRKASKERRRQGR